MELMRKLHKDRILRQIETEIPDENPLSQEKKDPFRWQKQERACLSCSKLRNMMRFALLFGNCRWLCRPKLKPELLNRRQA